MRARSVESHCTPTRHIGRHLAAIDEELEARLCASMESRVRRREKEEGDLRI